MKFFLIGMMGSGKSHWKKRMAAKMKTGGYDLDFLVEADEERTIEEIFKEEGEPYFRKAEAKILRWFGEKKAFVLATGGGTPCFHENMKWMNQQGITIWIDEPVEVLAARLKDERQSRPAIQGLSDAELLDHLTQRFETRKEFYSQAKFHLKGDDLNDKWFAKLIKENA